ncbi:adenosylcobinamide amidohydrolase [Gorillibacterium sp. CAU 1737]|uniref:adenosylcobinamide amidohydrolase n=1 Tax=Gorillibacterium sp. CAU 1737 TaxID=3140362 RepID=UPI00325FE89B
MTQPFLGPDARDAYPSKVWPGLHYRLAGDCLLAEAPALLDCLSNAVYRGGRVPASRFVNRMVHKDYAGLDPEEDIRRLLAAEGLAAEQAVGLLTAAVIRRASLLEEAGDRFRLSVCTTSGTRNAARAGYPRETYPAYSAGTINTIVLVDGGMSDAAMVNALLTAAEAKAAALQDAGILDPVSGRPATGTTTDAIVLAVSQAAPEEAIHLYAGTATSLGDAIGRLVYRTILETIESDRAPVSESDSLPSYDHLQR